MADKILTTKQAAAYIGRPERTVADWRARRQGPPWILASAPRHETVNLHGVHRGVRYLQSALDTWLASRVIDPATLPLQPAARVVPRVLTDAEWAMVDNALLRGVNDRAVRQQRHYAAQRRAVVNALIHAVCTGGWPSRPPGHTSSWALQVKAGLCGTRWLLRAFAALAPTDLPVMLAVQIIAVRNSRNSKTGGDAAFRLRTEGYGPTRGGGRHQPTDSALNVLELLPPD